MNPSFKKIVLILSTGLLFLSAQAGAKKINGQDIYEAKCAACHASGETGAPKLTDKKDWQPRLEKGIDKLFNKVSDPESHVSCHKCTDGQIKEAIKFMATETGSGNKALW